MKTTICALIIILRIYLALHITSPKQLTAIASAFIIGLVELNSAGHLESEKGFDDPTCLINSFLDLMFV